MKNIYDHGGTAYTNPMSMRKKNEFYERWETGRLINKNNRF
jgi:hypothetical protein